MRLFAVSALLIVAVLGAGLAGLYFWNSSLVRQAEQAFPPIGRFAVVDGLRLHYLDRGQGPAVVLLHGVNGAVQDFSATIMADLATRYRVIAIDRPGHGYSERPEGRALDPAAQAAVVRGLLRQLGVDEPLLVGFSWSGSLVLAYALAYGEEIGGVVTLAGAAYEWPTPVDLKYRLAGWPVLGRIAAYTLPMPLARLLADEAVAAAFAPEPVPESYQAAPWPLSLRPESYIANAADVSGLKPFLRQQSRHYDTIRVPLVIVTGDQDNVVSPTLHSEALHRAVPHSERVLLPGAGHPLPYTHPDAVIAAIDRAQTLAQRYARAQAATHAETPSAGRL